MAVLKFLGRGSAFNVKEGNTSAYIKEGNKIFLLDCGETIFSKIIEKNLLDEIEEVNVFITHCHSDHIGSLSSLIYYCYFVKNIVVKIYSGTLVVDSINDILVNQGHKQCEYVLNSNVVYKLTTINENFKYCSVPVFHQKGLATNGFILEYKGKRIFYSGDTSYLIYGLTEMLENFDEIYHDTCLADYDGNVHTSLRKLSDAISKKYRNKVYCMHLDCNELIDKAKEYGFNVVEIEK